MDSRPGILIHEISHFKNVGRTVDHADGEVKSLDLAIKNPKDALFNADSFEYFMEA
ncbi:M35 family metallo-endopeptidase [Niastella populi]|uniref:M35 family metallo-endopeptidase n=1 Tax=Niastella populi TaxID=550983 RepID=UPI0013FD62DB|nr:M35 family metallo-endopeptidase [Niastella populi]